MKSIHFTKTEWLLLLAAIAAIAAPIILLGCGRHIAVPVQPGQTVVHAGPAGAVAGLAVYAAWAAGVGLLLCGVAAVFLPNKIGVAKVAVGCIAALAISFLLGWVAAHAAIVMGGSAAILLLGTVAYIWLHRVDFKKKTGVDLNWLCKVKKPKP